MASKRCFAPNCTQKIVFVCNCIPSETLMCNDHIGYHVSIKGRDHDIQSILLIDPKIEKFALDLLYEEISKIKQLKTDSLNVFAQLIASLKSLLKILCEVLNMNLTSLNQKAAKIKTNTYIWAYETDDFLRSLLLEDAIEAKKMCLVDEKIFLNVKNINIHVNEIHRKLNVNNLEDVARNNFEDFTSLYF